MTASNIGRMVDPYAEARRLRFDLTPERLAIMDRLEIRHLDARIARAGHGWPRRFHLIRWLR